jgi:hypothetical protein
MAVARLRARLRETKSMTSSANLVAHFARCCPRSSLRPTRRVPCTRRPPRLGWRANPSTVPAALLRSWRAAASRTTLAWSWRSSASRTHAPSRWWLRFRDSVRFLHPGVVLLSTDTVARTAALIDEVLQTKPRHEILPRELGHTALADVVVPATTPVALYSTTVDAWTSSAGDSYAALMLHYITEDSVMRSHVIALRYFPPPHNAKNYDGLLDALLEENGLRGGQHADVHDGQRLGDAGRHGNCGLGAHAVRCALAAQRCQGGRVRLRRC